MTPATIAILASALLGQAGKADERLELMKSKAASYRFERDDDRKGPMKLQAEPAFRMGKQGADVSILEGAIFFWTGDDGRPEAAAQIFEIKNEREPDGLWIHEFISLAPGTFSGTKDGRTSWTPRAPGVEFRPVPGAPKPGNTASARTRQMKALAQEFHASDHFNDRTWIELRLLPTPIARYGKEGSAVRDGGLFAFVTGTDPEAFLFLEVREGRDGPEWQYSFAPMTCYELKGSHAGKTVWTVPFRTGDATHDASRPYFVLTD